MTLRSDVAPDTLPVRLTEDGVEVEYTDGRTVFYRGVPTPKEPPLEAPPGKDVHVLVTDDSETEGVLVYVDERATSDEILADTGVGRVILDPGETTSVFPGVSVTRGDVRITVAADFDGVDGRVFVFAEDELGEQSYELVTSA
jgi:hypothetical protein